MFNGLAARLDAASLKDVLTSSSVTAVTPNCVIQLDKGELLTGEGFKHTALSLGAQGTAGRHDGRLTWSQPSAPWGLDRLDSRYGLDGSYEYGTAR